MPKPLHMPGADRTTKWFADDFSSSVFSDLEKIVLHSTETPKTSGCPGYRGGAFAPTLTINPWPGYQKVWQHFPLNESARALVNASSTAVGENKDNLCQVEIVGYSDGDYGKPRGCYLPDLPEEGLSYLAGHLAFIAREWTVPLVRPRLWPAYPASYGDSPARMSGPEFDNYAGVCAHLHASGNTHGDVSIDIDRLLALARGGQPQEDEMQADDKFTFRNPVTGKDETVTVDQALRRAVDGYARLWEGGHLDKRDDRTESILESHGRGINAVHASVKAIVAKLEAMDAQLSAGAGGEQVDVDALANAVAAKLTVQAVD